MTKAQEKFVASVEKITSNNEVVDQIGKKVLYGIKDAKLVLAPQGEASYSGTLGKAKVSVELRTKGKTNETVLDVNGMEIKGPFAARAYKMAVQAQNRTGRKAVEIDEEQANSVLGLLG